MDRGLVMLGGTEASGQLLREAAEHATGANADLILLSTFTRRQYEHDLEVLDRIAATERDLAGEEGGAEIAREAGRRILSEAEERECDHVFLTSKRRSRIGRTVGDTARRVLREFDGVTSLIRERDPERRLARLRGGSIDDFEMTWMGD